MKKTNRIKINLPFPTTRDEAECLMTDLAIVVNNQRKIQADRDAAVLEINERCAPDLAQCEELIKAHTEALRAWAEANPDQFPKGRKSLPMSNGVLGFRTGTPKLSLFSRAFTWEKVLQALRAASAWCNYIRIKEEVDKEAILASHSQCLDKPTFEADLRRFGIKVSQDESFYVEPNLTETTARQTVEAA